MCVLAKVVTVVGMDGGGHYEVTGILLLLLLLVVVEYCPLQ